MDLPFGLSGAAAVWLAAAVFVAAFVRGYSGFGFAALVVSAASLVTNPLHAVPVVILCDIVMTAQQVPGILRHIDWRRVGSLLVGAFAGAPIGIAVLTAMGVDLARAVIAAFILLMCAVLWAGWAFRGDVGRAGHVGVGFLSGLANGAGIGGLPVAAFFAAQPVAAPVFRATLIAYFTLMDLWTLPFIAAKGLVSGDTLRSVAVALPLMVAGIWLGGRHFLKAAPANFRRFTILLLAALAILGLARSAVG